MCAVCRHPDRIAIDAALSAGRALRSLAADYPNLNKSTLGRHRKQCMTDASLDVSVAPGSNVAPQNTATIRRRTRPIEEAQRFDIALRMKARGCTRADIARALDVHPSTVGEIIRRGTDNAVERVRSETVEELVAQRQAERDARARKLAHLQERAELRGDVRTQLDVLRHQLAEDREQREWMRELGAFDRFRIPTEEDRRRTQNRTGGDLIDMFREVVSAALSDENAAEALSRDIPPEQGHSVEPSL